ncbi:MAG TPA: ATP-binding protein [Burkholderiales bacterium]|nr:ATP-binding protein [Burkholderiales bacterium]
MQWEVAILDSNIIEAISAAVAAAPENVELRLHLASLLSDAGRAREALEHCQKVLSERPDHRGALMHAERAASALGDEAKAAGFRRLTHALGAASETRTSERGTDEPRVKAQPLRVIEGGLSDSYWEAEQSTIKLVDVAGMEEVKRRLNLALLAPLRNPEMMKLYGKTLRGGLMLYGPPGCGKTFIARATAGEMGARFVSVGLADVLDMWLGQSERNLHEIFDAARRAAPCVLFFDEIDALGRKRSLMRQSAGRDVVNQLLAELDNVSNDNRGVFVLAATNHPWDVDIALRRPGRLDRTLLVLPPDEAARETILHYHLGKRPTEDVDLRWLANKTEAYSGADLAHLVESAAELAMEESLASGKARPLRQGDFKKAMKEVKPSTRPWFETARNYAMFANEGGAYDDLLEYLRAARMV